MTVRVPLRDGSGHVRAYAIVDQEDALNVMRHRWQFKAGYVARNASGVVDGRMVTTYLHRQVLGLKHGDGRQVDHVNGDPLDNRKANLRVISHAGNMQNRRAHRGGSSRFRGVHWDTGRGKWRAMVRVGGRNRHVGWFTDELAAARAADAFRSEHMPFAMPDPKLEAA